MDFADFSLGLVGLLIAGGLIFLSSKNTPRSRGKNLFYHLIYGGVTLACFLVLPMDIKDALFTPLVIVVVGTIYPVYESVVAVCTVEDTDDTTWLTYWIAQGVVSFSTEWVDGLGESVSTTWNMFEFFFYLWLLLPQTDGASMLYDLVLGPIVSPIIQPIVKKTEGLINKIIMAVTNAAHLSFVWIAFVLLPQELKRAIWIFLGTAYPLGSSLVSVTSPEKTDDTFWLTYWSCFGILFLIIDLIENYIGGFPGFYTLVIGLTIYLMLPLFRGADKVFREILVPLAGLQEMLVKKDAEVVKNQILKDIPPERRAILMKEIAQTFENGSTETSGSKTGSMSPDGYTQIV